MNKFNIFYNRLISIVKLYIVGLIIFFISRLAMIMSYSSIDELMSDKGDLISALIMGFRVDTQVMMYGLSVSFLVVLISPILKLFNVKDKKIDTIIRVSYIALISLFILILIGNYYFYGQFKSNYNLLIFAFFNDDTASILKIMWEDYPVLWLISLFILVVFILTYIIRILSTNKYSFKYGRAAKFSFVFIYVFAFFLAIRGSIGMFPLGARDLIVSDNSFLNNIATNGVLSLKNAISNKALNDFDININKSLKNEGFNSPEEALSLYLGSKDINNITLNHFFKTTKQDSILENKKINVVFVLMESMNGYYLDYHSNSCNLLGSLETELDNLVVFRNFLPKGPRTIHSLDGLIVNSIQRAPLSQTVYSNISFSSSNIKPFKYKGYHTVFASGSQLGWRNIGEFYSKQYFDEVRGDIDLIKSQKNATKGIWGVYDEYLFNDIFKQLEENDNKKPHMFFVLTTTNHTPYTLPDNYKQYPMKLNDSIKKSIIKDEIIVRDNFLVYQYANDQLGRFISKIRKSNFGDNTIIVATGDHTNTEMFNFNDNQIFDKTSVPLIMYIPEWIKKKINIDPNIYGSHKDIFPTIFNLALSNARYLNSGSNLFEESKESSFGVSNDGLIISEKGVVKIGERTKYYNWDTDHRVKITKDSVLINNLKQVEQKAKAYKASMVYYIQKEIVDKK